MAGSRPAPGRLVPVAGLVIALALVAPGCARQGPRAKVFPVRGQVKFQGRPALGALVVFHPRTPPATPPGGEEVPRSSAQVGEDGSFALTTYDAQDGAPPGDYAVTVLWTKLVGKGSDLRPGPNVIPDKYANPGTTPLAVTVGSGPNDLDPFVID